jgi:hypothetical protein
MPSTGPIARRGWRIGAAYFILILFCLVYVIRGRHDERLLLRSLDFKTLYGCARCLTHGCDPYDSDQIYQAYLDGGGEEGKNIPAFRPHEPVYMPPALAMMTPFTLLRWQAADRLWLCFSTGVFLLGVWLIASISMRYAPLTSAIGIGILLIGSSMPFMLAQPAQLITGLCAISMWCFHQGRFRVAGTLCLAVALAFKPHVAGFLWLYLMLSKAYRKDALRVLIATIVICIPGVIWASVKPASSHWLSEMRANVAILSLPGNANDPSLLNPDSYNIVGLQSILSVIWHDPHIFVPAAHAAGIVLLVFWLLVYARSQPSRQRDYLALASIVLISTLPVYHRDYDMGLLLLIYPATATLRQKEDWQSRAVAFLTPVLMIPASHDFSVLANRFILHRHFPHLGAIGTIFWLRSVSWAVLLLSLLYLGCFQRQLGEQLPQSEQAGCLRSPFGLE